jgi:hypothetical protein
MNDEKLTTETPDFWESYEQAFEARYRCTIDDPDRPPDEIIGIYCAGFRAGFAASQARQEPPSPLDVVLFCPECKMQHIDEAKPDNCENCGVEKRRHFIADDRFDGKHPCSTFEAWLNPPHKKHRCHGCNNVWRAAAYPTNGVAFVPAPKEARQEPPSPWVDVNVRLPELFGTYLATVDDPDELIVMQVWFDRVARKFKTNDHYRHFPGKVIAWMPLPPQPPPYRPAPKEAQ